ncbi:MAG: PD40 domain-containing protein [Bacteroidetes bacterium]|nr:PD40 domain-containing protein [Bacteroidota bacterium]
MKIYLIIFFLTIFQCYGFTQQTDIEKRVISSKATRAYKKAKSFYISHDYSNAEKFFSKAIKNDTNFVEAWLLLGDIYSDTKRTEEAILSYEKAIQIDPDFFPDILYIAGKLEFSTAKYSMALKNFKKYLCYENLKNQQKQNAMDMLVRAEFAVNAVENPVPFNLVNLGDSINTADDEYINAITSDEQQLIFTKKQLQFDEETELQKKYSERFFVSDKINDTWNKTYELISSANIKGNIGALCISPDSKYLFFTSCYRPDGFGSCDLYYSKKSGNNWSKPKNLGPVVNSNKWESQPSFSSDGKTLYFTSNRNGGRGSSDIWKTILLADGTWSQPENLGVPVNTTKAEMSPFIHPDDQTLYFSSEGHVGMGGADLFYSKKEINGNWSKPINLGYPINTLADEINIVVNAKGDKAYISSDKFGGKGKFDIYSFDLYEEARPQPVTYMKGNVFDTETKNKLKARFELIDLNTGIVNVKSYSDQLTGEFLVVLPINRDYALNVSKDGYLFYSENFALTGEYSDIHPYFKDIPLKPIKVGENVILKNIFFETDKYDLKEESEIELMKLIGFLNNNPRIKIEISGHTDNIGEEEYNLILSQNRAKAVYDYLILNDIEKNRLTYKGYGFSLPNDTNETEEGRANNRRTEFKVIGL